MILSKLFYWQGPMKEIFTDVYRYRMTYFSAHTKYSLVYKGVKYDSVTAEYV